MGEDAMLKAECPQCGQHIEFPAHGVGATIDCPSCSNPFTLAAPVPPVLPKQPAKPKAQKAPRTLSTDSATEKQIAYLRRLGYESRGPLTKGEASRLIEEQWQAGNARASERAWSEISEEKDRNTAWVLHEEVRDVERQLADADREDIAEAKAGLINAQRERVAFWSATFTAMPNDAELMTAQWSSLHEKFGMHCKKPTQKQIKDILEALDAHTPDWDKAMPQSFFHTLKESFPDLLR